MNLGDRMKQYEDTFRHTLPVRMPVIVRLDGRAFHTFTRGFDKPFDQRFVEDMIFTTKYLCEHVSGVKFGYVQSDEISLLLTNNDTFDTQPFFDNNLQKIVSVCASIATAKFVSMQTSDRLVKLPHFDGRAFVLPPEEVANYFLWRQRDWERNSLIMLALSRFSQKEIHGLNKEDLHEKLFTEANVNWNNLATHLKRGTGMYYHESLVDGRDSGWVVDRNVPIFSQDREYITKRFKYQSG